VAGVSTRFKTFFRLSPAEHLNTSCFGVRQGEVLKRADVNFWRLTPFLKERFAHALFTPVAFGEVVITVQYGCSALAKAEPPGVPILRMNNLQDDGWNLSDLKYIELSENHLETYRLYPGDIIFNRTNSKELVGKCEVFRETGDWVFASYLIRVRTNDNQLDPQFASDFLSTYTGRLQIDRLSRQIIGMTNINAEEIREILIPLPPLPKQHELVAAMDEARSQRRQKLAQADALLSSLDDYLLKTVGLDIKTPQRKVFAVATRETRGRVDVDFHSLKARTIRQGIEHGIYQSTSIQELCEYAVTGFAAGKADQAFDFEKGVPHLRPLNLNIYGDISIEPTKFVPRDSVKENNWCQEGEVLFNNTNSTEMVGKSSVFDLDQPCACSNHMTRLRTKPNVNPYYLAILFNALRRTGYLGILSTNFNNQAGINTQTLLQLKVPCPPKEVQDSIVAEIQHRREEARRLRTEAETGWQNAKQWFEEQLMGAGPR
jgi:Restriction endonuclease S subunits